MPEEPQNIKPQQSPMTEGDPQQWSPLKPDQTPMLESKPAPELLTEHSEETGIKTEGLSPTENSGPQTQPQSISQTPTSTPLTEPAKPKNKNILIISILVGAIIVVAGILVYFFVFAK